MVSKIKFHVGYSHANDCWFVRFYPYQTQQQAENAAAAFTHYTREQALEEAAKLCDRGGAWDIADAIRALKSQPATEFGSKELVNSFNRGYVIACANIVNMYGAKVEVAEGFAQLSITKSDFEALELCSYDKDAIKTLEEFAGEEKLFVSSDHTPQTGGGDEG